MNSVTDSQPDREPAATTEPLLLWDATWARRSPVRNAVFTVIGVVAYTVILFVIRKPDAPPWWVFGLVAALAAAVGTVGEFRTRVRLTPAGLELRRIRTRCYPWSSLKSIELTEQDQIEITPNGWVRKLPIPPSRSAEALALIQQWRDRYA